MMGSDKEISEVRYLFDKDGEPLVLKRFGELDVLGSFVIDGKWSHNHVCQATQQLSHHAVPLLLIAVIHLITHRKSHSAICPARKGLFVITPVSNDSANCKCPERGRRFMALRSVTLLKDEWEIRGRRKSIKCWSV